MQRNLGDEIKYQFKHGGAYIRLLFVNIGVFLIIHLFDILGQLTKAPIFAVLNEQLFVLPGTFSGVLMRPWTLFTYMFAHFGFMHILGNMLFLYFGGKLFQQLLGERKLFYTYIIGGLTGALFQLLANQFIPYFKVDQSALVGASASVMAVIVAVGSYRPNLEVRLFGILPVKLMYIVLFFVISDFLNLTSNDQVGHMAHLGGALIGFLSIRNITSPSNFMNKIEIWGNELLLKISKLFQPKPKFKVHKNTNYQSQSRPKSDEEFLADKKMEQEKIDTILDKISKRGYDALTKEEKQFLFQQKK